ncbi:MAG: DinB family protein [Chlorobium phaeobacteroides]|uniref:DinB-like domain-containing protein n=1 Tax=Chlorobium phaeobacteroides (strain BS1) TaxID=331678 RepID=B3EJQ9_CHLPB|nr:DinB family protein [Chlorobium phaeobacteroides]MBL6956309.1 DinB family protein [Chlorobium phaeobacteroides]
MDWKEALQKEMAGAYRATEKLMELVSEEMLTWKPSEGENWMTMGQLLHHIGTGCGGGFKGFVTGDWGFPEGMDTSKMKHEDVIPPAERLPSVSSMEEAKNMLQEDKKIAEQMLAQCKEEDLSNKIVPAPWDPSPAVLGQRLLQSIEHLKSHKSQLYYYIKLSGARVGTPQLWGMG